MSLLLSVIIPSYNKGEYLKQCIESIENISIKDYEIIIVDDASSDGSYEKCIDFQKKYNNINILKHQFNCGLEQTRNDGINVAKGKWILFVDADDYISDFPVEVVNLLDNSDTDILLFNYEYFDINSKSLFDSKLLSQKVYSKQEFANSIGEKISWEMISCVGSKIYKRDFIENEGIRFCDEYKFNEDGAFSIMALMQSQKIMYINHTLYHYRRNDVGIMNSYKRNSFWTLNKVNDLLGDYFYKCNCGYVQKEFLKKKRVNTLLTSIREEIKFGTQANFNTQVDLMIEKNILNKICDCDTFSNESIEKLYIDCLCNNNRNLLIKLIRKELLNELYGKWIYRAQVGAKSFRYFDDEKINKVAIYGAGIVGEKLALELENKGIEVSCFIDRAKQGEIINGKRCIGMDDYKCEAQVIVNSVLTWNEEINRYINSKTTTKVVSVWKIIEAV